MPRLPLQEIDASIQHVPAAAVSLATKACCVAVAIVVIVVEHDEKKV